ncbi:integron integrase [Geomonas propionica]|uniref:Integron integrase n=1 Tax=Geomonas propionica TaxID=2798582 RepID=A0ABS0YXU1_9BACT|nr:integron integrase [Geomonas propionica]MBJ6802673.1 integron integrase [Geomonas propionica]
MNGIPKAVVSAFLNLLAQSRVPPSLHAEYLQWLRYYLDFCEKYSPAPSKSDRVRLFCQKLGERNQTADQQRHAAHAVSLYFALLKNNERRAPTTSSDFAPPQPAETVPNPPTDTAAIAPDINTPTTQSLLRTSNYQEAGYSEKSDSPEWDTVIERLAAEIKLRHYSRKTLKTYATWSRHFQRFLKNKSPDDLSTEDVKQYLTFLAVKCHVAASTQNQAFNALLFLYRHALMKDFGILKDVPRAKKSLYIPMVLSRAEIDAILGQLAYPYRLFISLLFGCGLRLFECLQLRVQDFNFDAMMLTIHGKGAKDRTVPLPASILPALKAQIEAVAHLHERDLAAGYDGVFLQDAVEKKYPHAAKELIHQWFFPQRTLTVVAGTGERRRHHLHETEIQEALHNAVRRAKILKRVTAHTFRHSFATHLLQANYDIRLIQKLLGHANLKTTMVYTHCVPVLTQQAPKSPLDF